MLGSAKFNIDPKSATKLNVVVFHHRNLSQGAMGVYVRIRDFVNNFCTAFRLSERPFAVIEAGDNEAHWGEFERFFSGKVRDNLFVIDFTKPRNTALDPAYPVIKQMLAKGGYLSQVRRVQVYFVRYGGNTRYQFLTLPFLVSVCEFQDLQSRPAS